MTHRDTATVRTASLRECLPQLDTAAIALRNRAYASPIGRLSDGKTLVWQGSDAVPVSGELGCRLAGQPFALAADNLSLLEPRLKGFESFVPSEACAALVEHALAPVLEFIEQLAGMPVECGEYHRRVEDSSPGRRAGIDEASEALCIGFLLLSANGQPMARGWMRAPLKVWSCLDFTRTPAAPFTRHRAVPVELRVQLGRCRLSLAELRDLATGDALRITPRRAGPPAPLTVQLVAPGGQHRCTARLMGEHLVLETAMNRTMDNTRHSTPPGPMPAMPTMPTLPGAGISGAPAGASEERLKDIECELSFELGSLRMTVAEIAQLRVGQSLMPGVRLQDQPVRILANGHAIGRGELAAVGDELVVVVTETGGLPPV